MQYSDFTVGLFFGWVGSLIIAFIFLLAYKKMAKKVLSELEKQDTISTNKLQSEIEQVKHFLYEDGYTENSSAIILLNRLSDL